MNHLSKATAALLDATIRSLNEGFGLGLTRNGERLDAPASTVWTLAALLTADLDDEPRVPIADTIAPTVEAPAAPARARKVKPAKPAKRAGKAASKANGVKLEAGVDDILLEQLRRAGDWTPASALVVDGVAGPVKRQALQRLIEAGRAEVRGKARSTMYRAA